MVFRMWGYKNKAMLGQTIAGVNFQNPVGLSAGFDKNFQVLPIMKAIGFGFMEGGSLTYEKCLGNPTPWFARLPKTKSLVVHVGLANQGVKTIMLRLRQYAPSTFTNFPLNISVAKTNSMKAASETAAILDYVGSLRVIKKSGIGSMVTLNISCPNTYGGEPFTTPEKLDPLLQHVDSVKLQQPVFVKMPSDLEWSKFEALLAVIVRHRVTGVTICNLAKDRSALTLKDPLPDHILGGLSGKATWELSNRLIHQTYLKYGDRLVIIGVGGVFSAEDAYTKIKLGASLVELITGMIFVGPQLIGQINKGLVGLLQTDGYSNIGQAIGADAR